MTLIFLTLFYQLWKNYANAFAKIVVLRMYRKLNEFAVRQVGGFHFIFLGEGSEKGKNVIERERQKQVYFSPYRLKTYKIVNDQWKKESISH